LCGGDGGLRRRAFFGRGNWSSLAMTSCSFRPPM
jgi:hypothetical protein